MFSCWIFVSPRSGLIVATLAVCWMPNQVRRIMAASRPKYDWTKTYFQTYMTLLPFSDTCFYLSSVINPLLYNVSSRQFRAAFWQVLLCRLRLQHANQERRLRAPGSARASARSARPLLSAPRRGASARTKVFLSTFQSPTEATPEPAAQHLSLESPEPEGETKPAGSAAENGFQEHEV